MKPYERYEQEIGRKLSSLTKHLSVILRNRAFELADEWTEVDILMPSLAADGNIVLLAIECKNRTIHKDAILTYKDEKTGKITEVNLLESIERKIRIMKQHGLSQEIKFLICGGCEYRFQEISPEISIAGLDALKLKFNQLHGNEVRQAAQLKKALEWLIGKNQWMPKSHPFVKKLKALPIYDSTTRRRDTVEIDQEILTAMNQEFIAESRERRADA